MNGDKAMTMSRTRKAVRALFAAAIVAGAPLFSNDAFAKTHLPAAHPPYAGEFRAFAPMSPTSGAISAPSRLQLPGVEDDNAGASPFFPEGPRNVSG
jgi:hypothetical protein